MKVYSAGAAVALTTLLASSGYAQTPVTYGVKGGLNMSTVSIDPDEGENPKSKMGGVVGGFVEMGVNGGLSVQPEFLFTMMGTKFSEDGVEAKANINYVQIPILVKKKFGAGSKQVQPFVAVGPGIGFRTSAKLASDDFDIPEDEADFKDETKATTFSLIFAGGVNVGPASVEARYDLGLTDIDDGAESTIKGRTFSILVGFGFGQP